MNNHSVIQSAVFALRGILYLSIWLKTAWLPDLKERGSQPTLNQQRCQQWQQLTPSNVQRQPQHKMSKVWLNPV